MYQVPIVKKAIIGRILAHRRHPNAVAQGDLTESYRIEEHNGKITAAHCRLQVSFPHASCMGTTLVALIAVALLAHAELGVATEWKERAHAAYVAGHYAEAEAG